MRPTRALWWLGLSIWCTGCALVEDSCRNFTAAITAPVETHRENSRNRNWAESAWEQVRSTQSGCQRSEDYAQGFKDGFAEYLYRGGDGEPPVVAPNRYRDIHYQNTLGYVAIQDWFAGYRHGALLARDSGARKWITGPTSLMLDLDPTLAHEVVPVTQDYPHEKMPSPPTPQPLPKLERPLTSDTSPSQQYLPQDKAASSPPLQVIPRLERPVILDGPPGKQDWPQENTTPWPKLERQATNEAVPGTQDRQQAKLPAPQIVPKLERAVTVEAAPARQDATPWPVVQMVPKLERPVTIEAVPGKTDVPQEKVVPEPRLQIIPKVERSVTIEVVPAQQDMSRENGTPWPVVQMVPKLERPVTIEAAPSKQDVPREKTLPESSPQVLPKLERPVTHDALPGNQDAAQSSPNSSAVAPAQPKMEIHASRETLPSKQNAVQVNNTPWPMIQVAPNAERSISKESASAKHDITVEKAEPWPMVQVVPKLTDETVSLKIEKTGTGFIRADMGWPRLHWKQAPTEVTGNSEPMPERLKVRILAISSGAPADAESDVPSLPVSNGGQGDSTDGRPGPLESSESTHDAAANGHELPASSSANEAPEPIRASISSITTTPND